MEYIKAYKDENKTLKANSTLSFISKLLYPKNPTISHMPNTKHKTQLNHSIYSSYCQRPIKLDSISTTKQGTEYPL